MNTSLSSLSIFFPFYNDAGTVAKAITDAYTVGTKLTNNLEVIAIHGGNSKDTTFEAIQKQKKLHPNLIILDKKMNTEGYAVIKNGFTAATKDWIFYTDGDLQYSLSDLPKLVKKQAETGADIVNGYKQFRGDSIIRTLLGLGYSLFSRYLFQIPIRDTDCDFRLIRRSFLKKISLQATSSSILPELIKKLSLAGATFAEVPIVHTQRTYGTSNYTVSGLLREKLQGDARLWWKLRNTSH